MRIRRWYRALMAAHFAAFLIEAGIFALLLALLGELLSRRGVLPRSEVWIWTAAVWVAAAAVRLRNAWSTRHLWRCMERRHAGCGDVLPVLEDLLSGRAHAPNPEVARYALEQFGYLAQSGYPWSDMLLRRRPGEYLAAGLFFLALPWAWSAVEQEGADPGSISATLHPPDYLGLPSRDVAWNESSLEVYPGTLFTCTYTGAAKNTDEEPRLKDREGSLFLAQHLQGGSLRYEVRVLRASELVLRRGDRTLKSWGMRLLEDRKPEVRWLDPLPSTTSWGQATVSFEASDDIALGDAFIVVNGVELEYAGNPSGGRLHNYAWQFDPLDHLDPNGGEVRLQVTVYDRDKVSGPKGASTPPLIWRYPGVESQSQDALAALDKLTARIKSRQQLLAASPQRADGAIEPLMDELAQQLEANLALPEDVARLVRQLQGEYREVQQHLEASGPSQELQEAESRQLARDQLYLDFVKKRLEAILQIVRSAELQQRLEKMADALASGEAPDPKQLEQLFQDMQKHLEGAEMDPWRKSEILQKMEQAQLSNMMGDREAAAQALKEASDIMRQSSNEDAPATTELTQRFREKMDTLDHLINEQSHIRSDLQSKLKDAARPPEADALRPPLEKTLRELRASAPAREFQETLDRYLKAMKDNQSGPETQEILQSLQGPEHAKGRQLMSTLKKFDMFLERMGQPGFTAAARGMARSLPHPDELAALPISTEADQSYRQFHRALQASPYTEGFPREIGERQERLAGTGKEFSEEFRRDFEMILPDPALFSLGEQGAWHAENAANMLKQANPQTVMQMFHAYGKWQQMRNRLAQIMVQQQSQMTMNPRLSVGKNGKLMLRRDREGEQDGENGQPVKDIEIALPEDFKKSENIEKRLRRELQAMPPEGENFDMFRSYMIDLLQ